MTAEKNNKRIQAINMQDLMLYYSQSEHDFTMPVINVLSEMSGGAEQLYPSAFIDFCNDNFYWDNVLGGYIPTTTRYQGMLFKSTGQLYDYWLEYSLIEQAREEIGVMCDNVRLDLPDFGDMMQESFNDRLVSELSADYYKAKYEKCIKIINRIETMDDINLLSDAKNTYGKCGRLPSELMKQRDEAVGLLKECLEELKRRSAFLQSVNVIIRAMGSE